MKYLFIVFTVLFTFLQFSHANDKSYDQLLKEVEALKKENAALKSIISGKHESVTTTTSTTASSQNNENKIEYIRDTSLDDAVSTTSQAARKVAIIEPPLEEKVDEEIEEIVVTATRTKQSIKDVGSSITVISNKQIENSKSQLIHEVLEQVPGIEVTRSQGIGGTTSIFMRGGSSSQTLVFIDGVEIKSATSGAFNFGNLTTDNIERVEVLRGPQSTLYGSEAIGGVINIITKKGKGPTKIGLNSEYGSHETYKETINMSGGKESSDYSASVSYLKTHGIDFSDGASDGKEEDGYENFTGSMRLGVNFLDNGRADTTLRVSHSDLELDDTGIDDVDKRQKTEEIFFSAKAEKAFFNDMWKPSLLVSVYDLELNGTDFDFESEDAAKAASSTGSLTAGVNKNLNSDSFRIPTRVWKAEHQSDVTLFDINTLTVGYEMEVQEGENIGGISKQTIYNHAYYLQNQIKLFDSLNLTMGLREDRHSEFGNNLTYRSSISYNLEDYGVRFHGSWGKGFRAPSINELFFPNFGNPELNPEESKGWDFGIEKELLEGKLVFDATYFENDFTDLIFFTSLPDGSFRAINIGKAEAEGVEAALTYNPFGWLSFIGSYTHNDTTDRDDHDQLARRPRRKATFALNVQPLEKLNVNLTGLMIRDRINSDGSDMDDYWTVGLVTKYDLTKLISAYIRAENLFDYEYEEVTGFNSLGRTIYGGIDLRF